MEAVLLALAGCTGMDVVSILKKKRTPLEGLTIEVGAERAPEHPKVFTKIHIRYVARGTGLRHEDVNRAVALSQDKYCPVAAMLRPSATLTWEVAVSPDGQAGELDPGGAPAGSGAARRRNS
jgi:putative redox protein